MSIFSQFSISDQKASSLYSQLPVPDIKELLKDRGLPFTTLKEFLVDVLNYIDNNNFIDKIKSQNISTNNNNNNNNNNNINNNNNNENIDINVNNDNSFFNSNGINNNNKRQLDNNGFSEKYQETFKRIKLENDKLKEEIQHFKQPKSPLKSIFNTTVNPQSGEIEYENSIFEMERLLSGTFNYNEIIERLIRRNKIYKGISAASLKLEYNKFIILKIITNDKDGNLLLGSPIIDDIWHTHILDTKSYDKLSELIGVKLTYNPNIEFDDIQLKRNRYINTLNSYRYQFQLNSEIKNQLIWPLDYLKDEVKVADQDQIKEQIQLPQQYEEQQQFNSTNKELIILTIMDHDSGLVINFQLNRSSTLQKMFSSYTSKRPVTSRNMNGYMFLFGKNRLDGDLTPLDIDWGDNYIILAKPIQP